MGQAGVGGWEDGLQRERGEGTRTEAGAQGHGRAWRAKGRCGETMSGGQARCEQRGPETDMRPCVSPLPRVPSTPRTAAGVCQGRGSREG